MTGQAFPAPQAVAAATLSFHSDREDPAYGAVDFEASPSDVIAALQHVATTSVLRASFRVVVEGASIAGADPPAVLGRYQILPDRVRFTPRFPPQPGVRYRAVADFTTILTASALRPAMLEFTTAKMAAGPATVVQDVYPTAARLPANLLRFYVWFSRPMQEGYARYHITLLGPDGKADAAAFFPSETELWDPSMQRLTVLLDPGRIKRGVGPNLELGPPLREGGHYTLKIAAGMIDARGLALRTSYSKAFSVTSADRAAIDPRQWHIFRPSPGTRRPLIVAMPEPLDRALLARTVRLVRADQSPIAGRVRIDRHETRWAFLPASAWTAGSYRLEVDSSLEDVGGNTTWAPFDIAARGADPPPGPDGCIDLPIFLMPR